LPVTIAGSVGSVMGDRPDRFPKPVRSAITMTFTGSLLKKLQPFSGKNLKELNERIKEANQLLPNCLFKIND